MEDIDTNRVVFIYGRSSIECKALKSLSSSRKAAAIGIQNPPRIHICKLQNEVVNFYFNRFVLSRIAELRALLRDYCKNKQSNLRILSVECPLGILWPKHRFWGGGPRTELSVENEIQTYTNEVRKVNAEMREPEYLNWRPRRSLGEVDSRA